MIEKCFKDDEQNYLILGSKPFLPVRQEIVEANRGANTPEEPQSSILQQEDLPIGEIETPVE